MVWFLVAVALIFMASTLDAGTVVRICILAFLSAACPPLVIPAAVAMFALWLIGEARRDAKAKRDRDAAYARWEQRQRRPTVIAPPAAAVVDTVFLTPVANSIDKTLGIGRHRR